jgi:hypothetical protein
MKILRFNWQAYDPVGGVKYVMGIITVLALSTVFDFPWFATGLSAALAWLTTLPGRRSDRVLGVFIYIVAAAALIGLAYLLSDTYWPWLLAMLAVAFFGTFAMIKGMRGFMIAWCLICWFYCTILLGVTDAPGQLLASHLLGSGVVFVLMALPMLWEQKHPGLDEGNDQAEETDPPPSLRFVLQHSMTVGI